MDEFSQNVNENGENELNVVTLEESSTDDIQFEDAFDVENLLKTLQENPDIDVPQEQIVPVSAAIPLEVKDKNAKKYVIYINPDNIDFMEGLSIPERKNIINKILKEQNEISIKKKKEEAKKAKVINAVLAFLTVVICLPLFFMIINKATTATILNYKEAKQNFSRLYRQEGKIKRSDIPSTPTVKY